MIRWFCTAYLSLYITRWSPWKRSSEETLLKWSWSKRDIIRFSVAVVSGLDETQCVGNAHNKLAVGVLMSSTSWPARPSTLVFLFSNHFNINSSAIFVTWRPNYDIFIVNSVKMDFSVRSSTFHIHAILKHAPVLSQNSLKMQLLYALSAALLQKGVLVTRNSTKTGLTSNLLQ